MNKDINKNLIKVEQMLNEINNADAVLFSEWTRKKVKLRYSGKIPQFHIIDNFLYWGDLGVNIGSEQDKLRPVLVFNTSKNSPICTIIPLTTKRLNDGFWYHVDLDSIEATALIEQLKVISKLRIQNAYRKKGKLVCITQSDWNNINKQLEFLYRLKPLK